ncbi:hypothetical protein [Massilia sp. YIM B04103]|uniref:hypothetical protein n=1 Tax=Massilia sp. YIM B04103 TaxID=2963106 RepID=UPI00210DED37|nr:hypothetical protein [Massilia sp. YIM B04103]
MFPMQFLDAILIGKTNSDLYWLHTGAANAGTEGVNGNVGTSKYRQEKRPM